MKVCFVTGEYPPMQGGIADYTHNLAATLHAQDVEVSILTSSRAGNNAGGVPAASSASRAADGEEWPVYATIDRWSFRSWPQILQHLRSIHPDVVHIQYQTSAYAMHPAINLLPLWLRRQREHPAIVTTFHDMGVPYLFPKAGRLRHTVTSALIRGSDRTIVTNAQDRAIASSLSGSTAADGQTMDKDTHPRVRIVPIGSSIPVNPPDGFQRPAWRTRLGVAENDILLSYFGFLNQSKGVETLLEALRDLVDRGVEIKLLMVGAEVGDSDPTNIVYRRRIIHIIDELGLREHVLWTGFGTPREVSGHLLSSDMCALPFKDGASFRRTTLLTALAHGLPVVSTRVQNAGQAHFVAGSVEQQIEDGEHAILVAPGDAKSLVQAIEDLIHRPELRQKLAAGGSRLAQTFSWPFIARQTISIYEEILSR